MLFRLGHQNASTRWEIPVARVLAAQSALTEQMTTGKVAMTAAVLSIGTELTRGELINSNAAWLGEQLTALGFEVTEHFTVDDDIERIVEAVQRLTREHQVVLSTGGLGPTTDDLTTEAVARALGVKLVRDAASLERISNFFTSIGRVMSPSNAKLACC
jgi:nicotinamide-nucleotide amidase